MRPFATVLGLGACLTLSSASVAQSSNQLGAGQALDAARTQLMLPVKNDKQQMEKNKACGAGKVFVKGEGCVKREKAEKQKAKEKEEKAKEKAKQTPPPPPPPPAKEPNFCCSGEKPGGGGGYSSCAPTEAEARDGAIKAAGNLNIPTTTMSCRKVN